MLLAVSATVNAAAMFPITQSFGQFNGTTNDWIGYVIELEPGGMFDVSTGSSSVFTLDAINSDTDTLIFTGGPVVPTAMVTFTFDIMVVPDANGSFKVPGYAATPIAVPEPAIMSMLGLGAISVIRKRRS